MKSFAYLYNEEQFVAALAKDVLKVKTLPKDLEGARRKKKIPSEPQGVSFTSTIFLFASSSSSA